MRFFKSKRFLVPTIAVLLILAAAGGALAATMWSTTVPLTFTVAGTSTYNLELYQDAGLTTPLTSMAWGTLNPGDSNSVTVYVKNVGNQTAHVSIAHNMSTSVGTITATPTTLSILSGSSDSMVLLVSVSASAPGGNQSVTITVNNNDA